MPKRKRLAIGTALLIAMATVSAAYAATDTASGTDYIGSYSLYSAMSVTDGGAGNYWGETYGEALSANVDQINNRVRMQELCNLGVQTDYDNTVTHYAVSWVTQTSPTVGYATGALDCIGGAGQAIRNAGLVQWYNGSPSLSWGRYRTPCINLKYSPC